jgi:hypothetical protein
MSNLTLLSRGQPYPLSIPTNSTEGATAEFLRSGGNRLLIVLPGMDAKEEKALRSGIIKAGFLHEAGEILWLFQIYGDKGPLLTLDAPFDARIIPREDLQLYSIDNVEQRLVVELHAIDEHKTIRALRALSMPNELTLAFLSAVQEQFCAVGESSAALSKWLQYEPNELIKKTQTWTLGQ